MTVYDPRKHDPIVEDYHGEDRSEGVGFAGVVIFCAIVGACTLGLVLFGVLS